MTQTGDTDSAPLAGGHFAGRERDPSLDALRGISILLVVLFHFTARIPADALEQTRGVVPVTFGWIGVYFFFVLSGYCIQLTLSRASTVKLFLARRISRIYPAFAVATLLLFAFVHIAPVPSVPSVGFHESKPGAYDLALNLLFIGELGNWISGSFWSIAVEVRFYILLAALALVLGTGARLARAFAWLSLGVFALWVAVRFLPSGGGVHPADILAAFGLAPYLPFFAVGILAHHCQSDLRPWMGLLVANLAAMAAVLFDLGFSYSFVGAQGWGSALGVLLVFATLMALFAAAVRGRLPNVPGLTALLASVGFVSYSWYLVHEVVGLTIIANLGATLPAWVTLMVAIGATYALAWSLSKAVEWRFRRATERLALLALTPVDMLERQRNPNPEAAPR